MVRGQPVIRAAALLQVLLLVVALDGLVAHGQLHALTALGAPVHEIPREDDAIAGSGAHLVEQLDGLVVTAMKVANDDGTGGHGNGYLKRVAAGTPASSSS